MATKQLDCVCLIHGDKYPWIYVDILYSMLCRNLSLVPRLHVFTESYREIPGHMIKHSLDEWPTISGTRKAWWYKMQMFDPKRDLGTVLYLDLDVAICGSLDWISDLDSGYFWGINDWRRLWRTRWQGINSSMMYWDTKKFPEIWQHFSGTGLAACLKRYHGDQDLLTDILSSDQIKYFNDDRVRSWRWQIWDGGLDPRTRKYISPDRGAILDEKVSVMVFHGSPKPHEVRDPVIQRHWNLVFS